MRWRHNLRHLRACSWTERWLLLEAGGWLGLMGLAVWLLPFRWVAALLGLAPGETGAAVEPATDVAAARVGWALRAIAARTPWSSTCLVQALAGLVMLRRRHIAGTLYLGVAKDSLQPEALAAHAWLRCGPTILTGAAEHQHFIVIAAFSG